MSTEYRHAPVKHFLQAVRTYPSLRSFRLRYHYQMAILNPSPTDEELVHNQRKIPQIVSSAPLLRLLHSRPLLLR